MTLRSMVIPSRMSQRSDRVIYSNEPPLNFNTAWDDAARTEVRMSELGAPTDEADGDLDVLAWKTTGQVLLLECKRLQLARTVAEIAEICRRFQGQAKDELDRHLQRARWVRGHPQSLAAIVGFVPNTSQIDARLVTNVHVPMMYLTTLPVPSDKIGPLRELELTAD